IAIIGNICLAYEQAYDTASESIEAINVAELKFNNIISSLYVLAGKSQLDSALVLMITKVWSTAKETNMMKDEVKDILYHFYMTARGLSSKMNVHISNLDIMRPFAESVLKSRKGVWLLLKQYPNTPVAAEMVVQCSAFGSPQTVLSDTYRVKYSDISDTYKIKKSVLERALQEINNYTLSKKGLVGVVIGGVKIPGKEGIDGGGCHGSREWEHGTCSDRWARAKRGKCRETWCLECWH
ncbi:uncharacterized protein Tco_1171608, partial [Tanacetum coccineum]